MSSGWKSSRFTNSARSNGTGCRWTTLSAIRLRHRRNSSLVFLASSATRAATRDSYPVTMEYIKTLLEQQPLMALFLTIAIGYLVGEMSIRGFSLGVGAVLFVALGVGWFAPKAAPVAMVGNIGLALFLYAVGIQYGKQFFVGLTSPSGLKANLIALIGVLVAGATTLVIFKAADLKPGYALGLFAGSATSTATLQAAITTLGNDD